MIKIKKTMSPIIIGGARITEGSTVEIECDTLEELKSYLTHEIELIDKLGSFVKKDIPEALSNILEVVEDQLGDILFSAKASNAPLENEIMSFFADALSEQENANEILKNDSSATLKPSINLKISEDEKKDLTLILKSNIGLKTSLNEEEDEKNDEEIPGQVSFFKDYYNRKE